MLHDRTEAEFEQGFGRSTPSVGGRQFDVQQMRGAPKDGLRSKPRIFARMRPRSFPHPHQARILKFSQLGDIFRHEKRIERLGFEYFRDRHRR